MKRKLKLIITASAASVLTYTALAQNTPESKTNNPSYSRERIHHAQRADRLNGAVKASDLIGITVNNYQNEKLGKVEDIGVDVESGRVIQVILSTGGFLGIGDTLTAVPPGALHHDVAQKVLHLEADKEKLRGAPRFDSSKWSEGSDSNHLSAVYTYYGEEPSFRFIHGGDTARDGLRDLNGRIITEGQTAPNGQLSPDGQRTPDRQLNPIERRNSDEQRSPAGQPRLEGERNRDGQLDSARQGNAPGTLHGGISREGNDTWNTNRLLRERQSMIPISRLSQLQKASKLMGTSIKNLQDEMLGKVENLLVDLPSGRILAVIVSSGGLLGTGGEFNAVPPTALRFNNERDILQLDASKEMLVSAPRFKSTEWPDFGQASYADGIYRAYKVEPYFRTNLTAGADNTARNVRDRDGSEVTPLDQGNGKADVGTTARIRKEIMAENNLSVNARNVKIITANGRVTLRGPVNTAEEKRVIGEIAGRIAQSENVMNQLEVRNTTGNDR